MNFINFRYDNRDYIIGVRWISKLGSKYNKECYSTVSGITYSSKSNIRDIIKPIHRKHFDKHIEEQKKLGWMTHFYIYED